MRSRRCKDGDAKGINFSLSVAIELARLMLVAAGDDAERGIAANLLGNALSTLGGRESGTARLEEAIGCWDACLTVAVPAWLPERVQTVRASRHDAQAEIARRSGK